MATPRHTQFEYTFHDKQDDITLDVYAFTGARATFEVNDDDAYYMIDIPRKQAAQLVNALAAWLAKYDEETH